MATYRTVTYPVLYHGNGTLLMNLVRAWQDLTAAECVLQAYTTLVVPRIWSTLVFSFQPLVQADVANIAMEGLVFVYTANSTLLAVERVLFNSGKMFAYETEELGELCAAAATVLTSLIDLFLAPTVATLDMRRLVRLYIIGITRP